MNESAKTPWHLWVVGLLGIVWNGYGSYDYTMTQMRDREYIEAAMGPMGISVDEALAYFDTFPMIGNALWAVGVWVSLVGSILLLVRSRHAAIAFLVSGVGAIGSFAVQFSVEMPAVLAENSLTKIMPIVVLVIVGLQWWYARRQTASGTLR